MVATVSACGFEELTLDRRFKGFGNSNHHISSKYLHCQQAIVTTVRAQQLAGPYPKDIIDEETTQE